MHDNLRAAYASRLERSRFMVLRRCRHHMRHYWTIEISK
jgi:hypothetical protein